MASLAMALPSQPAGTRYRRLGESPHRSGGFGLVGQHQLVTTFESALVVASPGGGLVAAAPG